MPRCQNEWGSWGEARRSPFCVWEHLPQRLPLHRSWTHTIVCLGEQQQSVKLSIAHGTISLLSFRTHGKGFVYYLAGTPVGARADRIGIWFRSSHQSRHSTSTHFQCFSGSIIFVRDSKGSQHLVLLALLRKTADKCWGLCHLSANGGDPIDQLCFSCTTRGAARAAGVACRTLLHR